MSAQFIYTMYKLGRFHPPDREVLENISLSFYPGAKIGVLGANGAGKSIAAADHGRRGRRLHRRGPAHPGLHASAMLDQEPQLDEAKDVMGNVMDGVAAVRDAARARTTRSWPCGPTPTPTTRRSASEQAALEDRDRRRRRVETSSATSRSPWTRCAARPTTPRSPRSRAVSGAASRCAGSCCQQARPAAARRADEPPRRRVRRVAGAVPAGLPRHRRRHHPRPLLPRQRGRLDPRARPRPGHPVRGQLLVLAGAEAGPPRPGGEAGVGPPAHAAARAGVGAHGAARPARPRARPASPPTRSCWPRPKAAEGRGRPARDLHPARAIASATW